MMTHTIRLMLLAIATGAACVANAQAQVRVETLSGTGQAGLADSNRQVGQLNRPHGLAVDGRGNVYVSDRGNHAIRAAAPNGVISALWPEMARTEKQTESVPLRVSTNRSQLQSIKPETSMWPIGIITSSG
jgi:hypothetical protein